MSRRKSKKRRKITASRRKSKKASGLLSLSLLPVAMLEPFMAWDGFTTSVTRKRRRKKKF